MKRLLGLLAFSTLAVSSFDNALAQWVLDGKLVCSQSSSYPGAAIPDGAGGAIIVWKDSRNGDYDIFARRIDASGNTLWASDGVAVCTATGNQESPVLVSDGVGGAIIAWQDPRTGGVEDIYAQRINSSGATLWTANGVALCTALDPQVAPHIVSDGSAGAIVVWQDGRSGVSWDIYARRVNSAGVPQWTANGVAVCTAASGQVSARLTSDGAGGAIVTWDDGRLGPTNTDIYAQRLNASGTPLWAPNGVALCAAAFSQTAPRIESDGAGGAIVTWYDERIGASDIYAQRVNATGAPLWVVDGVPICSDAGIQVSPEIISDGAGGAIMAWQDLRNGLTNADVYAQRVTGAGTPLWAYDGVALCTETSTQNGHALVSDGAQGAIVAWVDYRAGLAQDIYARRINANGVPLWNFDGVPACTAALGQSSMVATGDGNGGVIAAWADGRSGGALLFAQRMEGRYGYWGRPEPTIGSAVDNPSDQGGKAIVRWTASQLDRFDVAGISHYSLWRATDVVALNATGSPEQTAHVISDPRVITRAFAGTALWQEVAASGPTYWEWVGNLDATYQSKYSYTAPTRQDSTIVNPATTYFKVLAHEYTSPQSRVWESGSASARSVDNLAPAAPLLLTIRQSGSNAVLSWKPVDDADLEHYTLYRAGASGVQIIPINKLNDATLPNYTDIGAAAGGYYYVVTAKDIHGNRSAPSNEVSLSGATGIGDTPPLTALSLQPNFPNPFSTRTELNVGAPVAGAASIELFDIAGRIVLARPLGTMRAGWQRVAFDAVDNTGVALASGVYLCRVRMNGQEVTGKMVIAR